MFSKNHVTYGTENMNYYWINQKDVEIQLEDTIVHILKGEPVEETQTIAKLFVPTHAFWVNFIWGYLKIGVIYIHCIVHIEHLVILFIFEFLTKIRL